MRNLHKLMIVLFSVAFIASGVFAQSTELSPKLKGQLEKKAKTENTIQVTQSNLGSNGPTVLPNNSVMNTLAADYKMQGNTTAYNELLENAVNPANYKPITINIDGTLAYAYVAYDPSAVLPNGPATFDTDTPGTISSLGVETSADFIAGGSWADDVWYGVEYGTGTIYTMDITTGEMIMVGTSGVGFNGMAYDPSTSTMFAATGTDLYTVDLTNGAATMVGSIQSAGDLIIGLACSADGELYGTDIVSSVLYSIDPATGAGTVVGPLGVDINYAQGLEFDNDNGILYAAAYTTTGELYTIDPATGTATFIGTFAGGSEMTALAFPYSPTSFNVDLGIQTIVDPSSGVDLTATEAVTVRVKNYGLTDQSNFEVWYTLDGGTAVSETITSTLIAGESMDHTFATTEDLSAYGSYEFVACVVLTGDEDPDNDCKTKTVVNDPPSYCDASTTNEDEFIGQVICGDIDNTTGFQAGVGDYTDQSTMIVPAASEDITVINGGNPYASDAVSCWVDWNDDYVFELGGDEEFILTSDGTGASFTGSITAPATAIGGEHRMRVRMVYSSVPDPCGSSTYGEVEDYTIFVGGLEFGNVTGNVMLDGIAPYNFGDVTEVVVAGGSFETYPDASGDYDLEIYPGTYDITATLYGYTQQVVAGVVVDEGATVTGVDFTLPSITGRIMGTVTDVDTGDPIDGAEVSIVGTEMMFVTGADGMYELFVEAGTYSVKANHANYGAQTVDDVEVMAEMDTMLDFQLGFAESCIFSVELWDDYGDGWNNNTLTISVDGEVVLNNITLAAGTGPESHDFEVGSGSEVTCVYVGTAAQWDYENYYFIYNNDDEVVFSDGEGGAVPTGGTFDATCIVFIYGDLAGTVTEDGSGDPIEGAEIMIDDLTGTTLADGTYLIENVMIGTWDVYCEAVGYNPEMEMGVVILEEEVTTVDFAMVAPDFEVAPLVIDEELEIGETTDVMVNISNPGAGDVDWSAGLVILTDGTDDAWDIQMSFDVDAQTGAAGNAGAECDGDFYYSTRWASNLLHKYDLDGILIEEFSIPGVSGLRDLAFDGTYMYGGAAGAVIYEMDFVNLTLVSSISNAGEARSIAYDEGYDAFWVSNFGSNVMLIDKSGATLETIPNATVGLSGMYGSAYDGWTAGGPYLWIFDQGAGAGTAQLMHQVDLNTLAPTGFTFDVMNDLGPNASAIAGGLFTIENVYSGTVSIGGLLQGTPDTYFMFELATYSTWISIDPTSGSLTSGTNEDMTVHLDATEIIIPGIYEAEIYFTTTPDVGSPMVDVTLTVGGLIPAINLMGDYDCTDIMLTWEMPTGGNPDSWNVYRDGTLLGNATTMEYTDAMVMPETEYTYYVTALYGGDESMATPDFMITAPIPEDLEPLNPEAVVSGSDVTLMWDAPDACVAPDGYNVYRDGAMINGSLVTAMEYLDEGLSTGLYEYKVMAVYYFGDSDFSDETYALITGVEDLDASMFQIFPNPATELVTVNSPYEISSIRVLNNAGQSVADYKVNAATYQIDVSNLQSGIYYIRIETEEGQTLQKIAVK